MQRTILGLLFFPSGVCGGGEGLAQTSSHRLGQGGEQVPKRLSERVRVTIESYTDSRATKHRYPFCGAHDGFYCGRW